MGSDFFFFLKSEFLSRACTTRHRGGHVNYTLCLGVYILGSNRIQSIRLWAACGHMAWWSCCWSLLGVVLPHPGSQRARGLAQAPVSSKNRSTSSTRFELAKSWGSVRGRPLAVRCLRRAAVYRRHFMSTCSTVCRCSPHGQAICSCVWGG